MVARRAHNPEVAGSSPASATTFQKPVVVEISVLQAFFMLELYAYNHNLSIFDQFLTSPGTVFGYVFEFTLYTGRLQCV